MREDLLSFIEWPDFRTEWRGLGLTDNDLWALQNSILAVPLAGPIISGTGGLRKLRFAPTGSQRGKSGALRVCYICFLDHGVVYLITVYAKSQKDDITPAEKRAIKRLIGRLEEGLSEHRRQQ